MGIVVLLSNKYINTVFTKVSSNTSIKTVFSGVTYLDIFKIQEKPIRKLTIHKK